MQRILQFFSQRATTLFFPIALILYDFAAYLTTDLIQPGIINVVRDFNADVSLAPASVSLYLAGGMALQWLLGPLSDRIGRRPVLIAGALIFTLACAATLLTTSMTQFLVAVCTGHQHLLYRNGRLRHGTGGLRSNQSH